MNRSLSLVTTCMNRNDFLYQTLPTWISKPAFDEIIIVDYSSKEKCKSIVDQYQNGKITIIEVPGQRFFNISKARNTGIRHISPRSRFTLMIDVDVKIVENFDDIFFDGNCRSASRSVCPGTVLLPTKIIKEVNGYNEYLSGYGVDDDDFFERIIEIPFVHYYYGAIDGYLSHIGHSAELRVANYSNKSENDTIRINFQIAKKYKWDKHCEMEDMKETICPPSILRKNYKISNINSKKIMLENNFVSLYSASSKNKK